MHDIDRTQREFEVALQTMQPEHFEFPGEFGEYGEYGETENYESEFEAGGPQEAEEMELAAEMLEVMNEAELDRFLGKLIRKVSRTARRAVRSPLGRALGGVLKPLAKRVLPTAGQLAGQAIGATYGDVTGLSGIAGGMVGSQAASAVDQIFGMELEGLSGEDQEFEVARRYVRFASNAIRNALRAAPNGNPYAIAKAAAATAARQFAPGLAGLFGEVGDGPSPADSNGVVPAGSRRRGTWIRRGRRIILLGV